MTQQPEMPLVPVEPTPEMAKRGGEYLFSSREKNVDELARGTFMAMLAADSQPDHGVGELPDLTHVIAWLENGCDPAHAVTELRIHQSRLAALKASEKGTSDVSKTPE